MKTIEKEVQKETFKETPHDRFKRLATKRTNEILRKLKILGNCSNRQVYEYTDEDIDKIFSAIERKVREVKAKFRASKEENFRL
ncbi:MAG TPA: hypothetical protein EYP21_01755 [Syntrophaceae bacterium]|nr:hypothetical protein [Syntrophaceae bacterium]